MAPFIFLWISVVNHQNIPVGSTSLGDGTGVKTWKVKDGDMYDVYIGAV